MSRESRYSEPPAQHYRVIDDQRIASATHRLRSVPIVCRPPSADVHLSVNGFRIVHNYFFDHGLSKTEQPSPEVRTEVGLAHAPLYCGRKYSRHCATHNAPGPAAF